MLGPSWYTVYLSTHDKPISLVGDTSIGAFRSAVTRVASSMCTDLSLTDEYIMTQLADVEGTVVSSEGVKWHGKISGLHVKRVPDISFSVTSKPQSK